jgi:hypothetical protein
MRETVETLETSSRPVFTVDGPRATIRLNRPRHVNRIQAEDLQALLELFDRVEADPAIRVLVITGTGRAFSSGYDLNSVAERSASSTGQTAGSAFEVMVDRLEDLAVPTICRLNGGSMAARPIWRWPAISGSASIQRKCSCRRRGSACIITRAASAVMCRGSAPITPRSCS